MPEFTQGVCGDGAAILKDGHPMTPDDIVKALNALDRLIKLRCHKIKRGKDNWYLENKESAWSGAVESLW